MKELEKAIQGRFSLPTLVREGIFEPNSLFISDPGKYVQSITLTDATVCDCDLVRFFSAASHFDI